MSGDNRKKKGGDRKDKKNERMREDVKARHEQGNFESHQTDQGDLNTKRPGIMGHVSEGNQRPSNQPNRP